MLHTWIRESGVAAEVTGFGRGGDRGGGAPRDEVVYEICLRVEGQGGNSMLLRKVRKLK